MCRFKRHLFHAKQNAGSIKKELLRLADSATQHVSWDVISYVRDLLVPSVAATIPESPLPETPCLTQMRGSFYVYTNVPNTRLIGTVCVWLLQPRGVVVVHELTLRERELSL